MQVGERVVAGPPGFWVEEVLPALFFFVGLNDRWNVGSRRVKGNPVSHWHLNPSQVVVGVGAHDLDVLRLQFQGGEQ